MDRLIISDVVVGLDKRQITLWVKQGKDVRQIVLMLSAKDDVDKIKDARLRELWDTAEPIDIKEWRKTKRRSNQKDKADVADKIWDVFENGGDCLEMMAAARQSLDSDTLENWRRLAEKLGALDAEKRVEFLALVVLLGR
jgi:hypothetical protein